MDPAAGTGISSCGVVVGAGAAAGKVPKAAAAVARGVVVVLAPVPVAAAPPAGAAAAAKLAKWKNLRRRWAQALLVLGCAAAALAFLSINSSSPTATADVSRGLQLGSCALTDAEAAALRAKSKHLLVYAGAQVLAATTALLVPAVRHVDRFLSLVGWQTGYHAAGVLLKLFECHGRTDAVVVTCYIVLEVVALVGYLVGSVVIVNSSY